MAIFISLLTSYFSLFTKKTDPMPSHRVRHHWYLYSNGTISSATMLMILISGLIAGPAVSL